MPFFTSQGKRLFYREQGEGPLLVVLHGNTASSACHGGELDHFGKGFHAVAMDAFGTGQSERAADWPHHWWLHTAHDAAALVEHVGGGPAVLVGASGGAVAGLLAAIHYGERVRAVVADSCVENWTPEEVKRLSESRSRMSLGQIAFWQHAHGDDWHAVVASDTAMIKSWEATGISFYDGRLSKVRCPVLLTDSLRDELLPRVGEEVCRMASEIRDCRVYLANDGRHPMMWSRAEDFRRESDSFLGAIL
jgi:valacyclovir hydrolase